MRREDVVFVARNMRDADRREIFATRWTDDADTLADDCLFCAPLAWCAWSPDAPEVPVAVFGLSPARPGVFQAWLFATDDFFRVAKRVTRFAKQHIMPACRAARTHRIEALSIAGHESAHKWMEKSFGATKEADHPGFGRRAEMFHTFAWIDPDVRPES